MASLEVIKSHVGETIKRIPDVDPNSSPKTLLLQPDELLPVCRMLYAHPEIFFDMLSCITGVDNGPEKGSMEVVYDLYSIPHNHALALKVVLPRNNPEIESVGEIWKTALWHERETFDLLGIQFKGHPDHRRILLPADWQGHPLQKDYVHQEYYRGVKVKFDNQYD